MHCQTNEWYIESSSFERCNKAEYIVFGRKNLLTFGKNYTKKTDNYLAI